MTGSPKATVFLNINNQKGCSQRGFSTLSRFFTFSNSNFPNLIGYIRPQFGHKVQVPGDQMTASSTNPKGGRNAIWFVGDWFCELTRR
jgi:hypothetical protein